MGGRGGRGRGGGDARLLLARLARHRVGRIAWPGDHHIRVTLLGEHAVMDSAFGTGPVGLLAKQMEEQRAQSSPEQKLAIEAERRQRARITYAANTAFIGMTALGFGLFVLHQL